MARLKLKRMVCRYGSWRVMAQLKMIVNLKNDPGGNSGQAAMLRHGQT
ncbi:hypothetical protein [Polaromonas sp.]